MSEIEVAFELMGSSNLEEFLADEKLKRAICIPWKELASIRDNRTSVSYWIAGMKASNPKYRNYLSFEFVHKALPFIRYSTTTAAVAEIYKLFLL